MKPATILLAALLALSGCKPQSAFVYYVTYTTQEDDVMPSFTHGCVTTCKKKIDSAARIAEIEQSIRRDFPDTKKKLVINNFILLSP